jgi:hypothetical protein
VTQFDAAIRGGCGRRSLSWRRSRSEGIVRGAVGLANGSSRGTRRTVPGVRPAPTSRTPYGHWFIALIIRRGPPPRASAYKRDSMTSSQIDKGPAQKISDDTVVFSDYKAWSLYGAPWWQTLATGRKSEEAKNGRNKGKPLPCVATACRLERMVRRGRRFESVRGLEVPAIGHFCCLFRRESGDAYRGGSARWSFVGTSASDSGVSLRSREP